MRVDVEMNDELRTQISQLSPWSHYYSFDDQTFTGFDPSLGKDKTFCTRDDPPDIQDRFRQIYREQLLDNRRMLMPMDLLKRTFGAEFAELSVLDIGCNDGLKAIYLKQLGARAVTGVEIRQDCIARSRFVSRLMDVEVDFRHHPASADCASFVDGLEPHDIVCSFGILYHLTDHLQHLRNLRKLATRAVILFSSHLGKHRQHDVVEDSSIPYRSYIGTCSFPSLQDIYDGLVAAGFDTALELKYHPSMGRPEFMGCTTYILAMV